MRFASNGYCLDRIFAFDWNTVGFASIDGELARLGTFIDEVLARTGAGQVNLIGHSMGTFLSQSYLEADPANAAKVAHYVSLAGMGASQPPGGVPSMAISSPDDHIAGTSSVDGGENVILPGLDHLQVATSPETFRNLYRFFNRGQEPGTLEMQPTAERILSGRLLTFAENQPEADVAMSIYPVDSLTGERLHPDPVATFVCGADGVWGPFAAAPGQHYEYEIVQPDPYWKPVHYYREPLPRSCDLVYFRIFPPPATIYGCVLGWLVNLDPEAMVLASLNLNQAVIDTRDTLLVGGYDISVPEVADPDRTTIAIFYTVFPGTPEGQAPGFNSALIFIQGFDLVVDTSTPATVPIEFNGRQVPVRNWKSGTDGVTIAVFE
jgi:pimeloyl-ACP methyl ester carboxylesterase